MTDRPGTTPFYATRVYRVLTGAFGAVLVGAGVYAGFFAGSLTVPSVVGGIVLVLLGGNMVTSACMAKESWLSRIGPLP